MCINNICIHYAFVCMHMHRYVSILGVRIRHASACTHMHSYMAYASITRLAIFETFYARTKETNRSQMNETLPEQIDFK